MPTHCLRCGRPLHNELECECGAVVCSQICLRKHRGGCRYHRDRPSTGGSVFNCLLGGLVGLVFITCAGLFLGCFTIARLGSSFTASGNTHASSTTPKASPPLTGKQLEDVYQTVMLPAGEAVLLYNARRRSTPAEKRAGEDEAFVDVVAAEAKVASLPSSADKTTFEECLVLIRTMLRTYDIDNDSYQDATKALNAKVKPFVQRMKR